MLETRKRREARRNRWMVLAVAVLTLLAVGCSSDSSSSSDPSASEAGSNAADVDSGTGGDGPSDLGNFPIPAPDGGNVGRVVLDESRSIEYAAADYQRVVDFYNEWTAQSGIEFLLLEPGPEQSGWSGVDGETAYTITAQVLDDVTFVALGVIEAG